ncbi:hypothetical protein ISF98_30845 [Burkholderia pseudomallei]|nr:hypothetical protein [Burkholderia pseudomallei]
MNHQPRGTRRAATTGLNVGGMDDISPLNSDPERLLNGTKGEIEKTPTGFVHRIRG